MSAVEFSAPPVDAVADLHGDPLAADLVLLLNGNQFMVVDELLDAYRDEHPEVAAVFYETLPPGILAEQLRRGVLRMGSLAVSVQPDVFAGGPDLLEQLRAEGLVGDAAVYAENELALLVRAGVRVERLHDLADGVRVALPDPEIEGIGRHAHEAIRAAGGDELLERVLAQPGAVTTRIHHRQSPLWLAAGEVDAAVVWRTEATHQLELGLDARLVEIPPEQNRRGRYAVAPVRGAAHPERAESFVAFMRGQAARSLYAHHGFSIP